MPRNKLIYSKDLDHTYILDSTGKQVGSMEGDQRNNPLAFDPNVANIQNVIPPDSKEQTAANIKQAGKDFVVNAAVQAPLAFIPGGGALATLGRLGAAAGAGYGMDSLLNPDKTPTSKLGDALLNTTIGETFPWLAEHIGGLSSFKIPGIRSETTSTRVADPTIMERTTTGSGRIQSNRQGSSSSSSESNLSREGISNTESNRVGETKGNIKSRTTSYEAESTGPHTDAMSGVEAEIARLESIDATKLNKGGQTQIDNAIAKNKALLEAMNDANTTSMNIRDLIGETKGTSSGEGSSTTKSKGTGQTRSSGSSRISGTGESSSSGSSKTTGSSTPGASTTTSSTVTHGSASWERILEAIQEMHKHTANQLTGFQRFLAGFIPQDIRSAKEDLSKK
jgi:hypothetical protein